MSILYEMQLRILILKFLFGLVTRFMETINTLSRFLGRKGQLGPWKNVPRFIPTSEDEIKAKYDKMKKNNGYSRVRKSAKSPTSGCLCLNTLLAQWVDKSRFGHLVDMYAWTPHCRNLDGISPSGNDTSAQNDWKGAWWHDSFTTPLRFIEEDSPYASSDQMGTYYFEFSRPLRTADRLQQDVQFSIGQTSKFSVAFWYPVDGKPWSGSQHYTVSCNWVPLDISPGNVGLSRTPSGSSSDASSAFALLLSVLAFCVSVFIGYRVTKSKSMPFTPIDNL